MLKAGQEHEEECEEDEEEDGGSTRGMEGEERRWDAQGLRGLTARVEVSLNTSATAVSRTPAFLSWHFEQKEDKLPSN